MARIKIKDLPKDAKITKEELKKVRGGITFPGTNLIYGEYKVESPTLKIQPSSLTLGGTLYDKD